MSSYALVAVDAAGPRFAELGLSGHARSVASKLAGFTNDRGWAWPSVRRLATDTGWHTKTIGKAIAELEAAGLLHVERGTTRRGNRYRLLLPGIPGSTPDEAPDVIGTGERTREVCAPPARNTDPADCALPGVLLRAPSPSIARPGRADPVKEPEKEPARASSADDLADLGPAAVPKIDGAARDAAAAGLAAARAVLRAPLRTDREAFEAEILAASGILERQAAAAARKGRR